ncbi:MAG: NAD(P)-dependent oxidoreductase [bacterium]|nr:NAD(P)-dependent oxidoreductase [bacterium]
MGAKKLRIVLLGGTGFVGSAVLRRLADEEPGTVAVNELVFDMNSKIDYPYVTAIEGGLPDVPASLFPEEPHILVHYATKQVDTDGTGFYDANVAGGKRLIEQLPPSTVGIIYGSSMSVYGQGDQAGIKEDYPLTPETALAEARLQAENIYREEMTKRKGGLYLLRPRFIWGAGDRFTIQIFTNMAESGPILGSGEQQYSIIDVDDYAKIIIQLAKKILLKNSKEQKPLNVGYKKPISLNNVLDEICRSANISKTTNRKEIVVEELRKQRLSSDKKISSQAVIDELIGLSHYCDISALESEIGTGITSRDPLEVFRECIAKHRAGK